MGEVKWIVSNLQPLLQQPDDPPSSSAYSAVKSESVEVDIVEGL